jgi:type I restriction enzyme S subunit
VLHLAKESIPSFRFAVPPGLIVEAFDAVVGGALERMQALEQESDTLAALRDTLLPKLISGELRVKNAEKFVESAV